MGRRATTARDAPPRSRFPYCERTAAGIAANKKRCGNARIFIPGQKANGQDSRKAASNGCLLTTVGRRRFLSATNPR